MESSEVSPGILSDPGIRELVSGAKGHVVHPSLHIQPCMFSRVLVGWLARICWWTHAYVLADSRGSGGLLVLADSQHCWLTRSTLGNSSMQQANKMPKKGCDVGRKELGVHANHGFREKALEGELTWINTFFANHYDVSRATTTARRWLSCCKTDHTSNSRPRKSWKHYPQSAIVLSQLCPSSSENTQVQTQCRFLVISSRFRPFLDLFESFSNYQIAQSSPGACVWIVAPPAPLCSESPEALGGKPEKDLGKQSGKRTADIWYHL